MPKYKDTRKFKQPTVKALGDDKDPVSPLGELLRGCLQVIRQEFLTLMVPPPEWPAVPLTAPNRRSVRRLNSESETGGEREGELRLEGQRSREWIIPTISNFSCNERILSAVVGSDSSSGNGNGSGGSCSVPAALLLSIEEVKKFTTFPILSAAVPVSAVQEGYIESTGFGLAGNASDSGSNGDEGVMKLEQFVVFSSRVEIGLKNVTTEMPFDVSGAYCTVLYSVHNFQNDSNGGVL